MKTSGVKCAVPSCDSKQKDGAGLDNPKLVTQTIDNPKLNT